MYDGAILQCHLMPPVPHRVIQSVIKEAVGQRDALLGGILRQTRDYLRDLTSGALAKSLGLGTSAQDVGRAIRDAGMDQFKSGGLLQLTKQLDASCGVVYSNGRVVSLHAYGQMTARAGLSNALQAGRDTRYRDMRVQLAKVTTIGTLCERCRPWEGCVVAMDAAGEEAQGYTPVALWYKARHPGCQHDLMPFFPGLSGPAKHPPDWVRDADPRDYAQHFKAEHPALLDLQGRGFANERQAKQLMAAAKMRGKDPDAVKGPRFREAGVEGKRLEATRRVLAGTATDYRQAMAQVNGEWMRDTGKGIFARETPPPGSTPAPRSSSAIPKELADIEAYAREHIANSVDLHGVEPAIAREIVGRIEERLTTVPAFNNLKLTRLEVNAAHPRMIMGLIGTQGIAIHPHYGTRANWDKSWEDSNAVCVNDGSFWSVGSYFPKAQKAMLTTDHEVGHLLSHQLTISQTEEWQAIYHQVQRSRKPWKRLSLLAERRPRQQYLIGGEAFAEAFAVFINGREDLLPKSVVQYLRKVTGL